ncbi:phage tail sheath subtilisin-like domain-containing protein [Actinomadura graeca]|uniref:Phage tail sheath subtilisin-like domain-containing protein n=1 Tax=Actinomadura graeca TaxID=2750812 RepID=A0ABX8QR54_9ACTN|nr:phage tail sheath subtilisin-like domain-containing protein [Actinomadura graeca]QXJ21275.1 phage tail sheath subtilisin-like domain-containing protein [Actinomadura graeca]
MAVNVGVNVAESDGSAVPAIAAAPTSVAALVGPAERGPLDQPVRLTGAAQFRDRFGRGGGLLGHALEGFFRNGGGTVYVSRVAGADSVPATLTLVNRQQTAAPALRLAAGHRGRPDPGEWGERLRVEVSDDPRGGTRLAADTGSNATSARLVSLAGIGVGSVLRFSGGTPSAVHRRVTSADPVTGTVGWADAVPAALASANTAVTTAEFRLTVRHQPDPSAPPAVVETWRNLSMEADSPDYVVARLNHTFSGSRYLTVTDVAGTAPVGERLPAIVTNKALENGADAAPTAADLIGDAAARTGLSALDTVAVQLIAVPDAHGLPDAGRDQVVRAALDYCAGRGDAAFVGSVPDRGRRAGVAVARAPADYAQAESDYARTASEYAARFQGAKVYGALYTPWIQVTDPDGPGGSSARFVPPDGHIMGVYARTDAERGIWKAPAGTSAQVRGALDVAARFTDSQHTDLVRTARVNGVRPLRGAGIVVAASRTLSTDTRWLYVNVRLLFNFVKSSLRDGLRSVPQQPHTERLRRSVRANLITPFLMGLWRQGAFGGDPPEQTFTVKCDAENNPPDQVDLGVFRVEVSFYPVRPAETVLIVVGQQPGGGSAAER